jgi:hypothetical protein
MSSVQSIAIIASDLEAGETLREYRRRVEPPRVSVLVRVARAWKGEQR